MYEFSFAPTIKPLHTSDVSEALLLTKELRVQPEPSYVKNIVVNDDGTVTYNGEPKKITQFGFESFCRKLGIPATFARKIPTDLLLQNIRRLTTTHADDAIVILKRENGDIAGIGKLPYKEPSYIDVLSTFAEKEYLKYINIGEAFLTICFWFDNKPIPRADDDICYVSTTVYSSILQACKVHAFSGVYRNSCENSFIMPYFGKVKANYKKEDTMLTKFADTLQCFDQNIYERLCKNFNVFNVRKLYDTERASMWKSLHRVVNSSEADVILKLEEETRKSLLSTVQTRFSDNKRARLEGKPVSENIFTDVLVYDALNSITSFARQNAFEDDKRKLERLAGDWIDKIILN